MDASPERDPFDDLQVEDVMSVEAPAPEGEAPQPPEGVSADPEPAHTPEPDTASASPEAPAAPDPNKPATIEAPWTPPTGDPFKFRVDGTEVTPTGAIQTPDGGVYLPPGVWDKEVRERYLGNRDVWRQTEQAYRQQIAQAQDQAKAADPSNNPTVIGARKVMDFLLNAEPEKVIEYLDNRRTNLPLTMAQTKAEILERQLTERQETEQSARMEQERAQALEQISAFVDRQVQDAVATPAFKALGADPAEVAALVEECKGPRHTEILGTAPPEQAVRMASQGWHVLGYAAGQAVLFNPQRFRGILEERAERATRKQQQEQVVQKAEKRNTATLTPPKPAPPAPRPRDDAGKFVEKQALDPKAARAILDDLTLDDVLSR